MGRSGQKLALIIEDDRNTAGLLRVYLEREGFHVLTAGDGETGVSLAEHRTPDIVILDLTVSKRHATIEWTGNSPVGTPKAASFIANARQVGDPHSLHFVFGNSLKGFVPRCMAVRVVNLFEMIDVNYH